MTIRLSCCELLQTEEMSTGGKVLRRIIEISKEGLFLSTQRGCLVISEKSTELSKIPFSDYSSASDYRERHHFNEERHA